MTSSTFLRMPGERTRVRSSDVRALANAEPDGADLLAKLVNEAIDLVHSVAETAEKNSATLAAMGDILLGLDASEREGVRRFFQIVSYDPEKLSNLPDRDDLNGIAESIQALSGRVDGLDQNITAANDTLSTLLESVGTVLPVGGEPSQGGEEPPYGGAAGNGQMELDLGGQGDGSSRGREGWWDEHGGGGGGDEQQIEHGGNGDDGETHLSGGHLDREEIGHALLPGLPDAEWPGTSEKAVFAAPSEPAHGADSGVGAGEPADHPSLAASQASPVGPSPIEEATRLLWLSANIPGKLLPADKALRTTDVHNAGRGLNIRRSAAPKRWWLDRTLFGSEGGKQPITDTALVDRFVCLYKEYRDAGAQSFCLNPDTGDVIADYLADGEAITKHVKFADVTDFRAQV